MVDLVGEFVETLAKQSSMLAKHRQGDMVEAIDAQLISGFL
jgi:transcription initiation factor TFIID subunit TAF12